MRRPLEAVETSHEAECCSRARSMGSIANRERSCHAPRDRTKVRPAAARIPPSPLTALARAKSTEWPWASESELFVRHGRDDDSSRPPSWWVICMTRPNLATRAGDIRSGESNVRNSPGRPTTAGAVGPAARGCNCGPFSSSLSALAPPESALATGGANLGRHLER